MTGAAIDALISQPEYKLHEKLTYFLAHCADIIHYESLHEEYMEYIFSLVGHHLPVKEYSRMCAHINELILGIALIVSRPISIYSELSKCYGERHEI